MTKCVSEHINRNNSKKLIGTFRRDENENAQTDCNFVCKVFQLVQVALFGIL